MKTNTIYCGECAETMRRHLPDNSIDLTVTSPPYDDLREYNGYTFEFEPIAAELWRVTKPGGVIVWVVADATVNGSETGTSFFQAGVFMGLGFKLETMIYRIKGVGAKGNDKLYWQAFEYMFILFKDEVGAKNFLCDKVNLTEGGNSRGRRSKPNGTMNPSNIKTKKFGRRDNVWEYQGGNDSTGDHPAPFPEALARDHIISWSNPGDIVLDPMCGSGTTLKMAVEQGRKYIGIDISREYCDLAQQRVNGARVPLPGLVGTAHNKPFKPNYYQPGLPASKASKDSNNQS